MIIYTRTITDAEQKVLENDLLDVTDWINKAIVGKINNCKTRAVAQARDFLTKEGATTLPTNDDVLTATYFANPKYENRVTKEAKAIEVKIK